MNTHMDRHASIFEDRLGVVGGKKFRFPQKITYVDPKISKKLFFGHMFTHKTKKMCFDEKTARLDTTAVPYL